MADTISPKHRSWNMSRVRSKDTKPEVKVRSMLHAKGFRFRKNVKSLPGVPDIVLPKYKTVVFVHGCFWHQHPNCVKSHIPKSNVKFWTEKLGKNVIRDKKHKKNLKSLGWKVIYVWECELKNFEAIEKNLPKKIKSAIK